VPLKYWETRHKGLQAVYPEEFNWRNRIGDSWFTKLKAVLTSPMMKSIQQTVKADRNLGKEEIALGIRNPRNVVYPESKDVFKAFKLCTFEHTKVVILGQDPYYDGSANGLAFGYKSGFNPHTQKSLDVIYKEVERDIYKGMHLNHDPSLESWAKQGVLLLNTVLTVLKGRPKSHANIGWERFSKIVLMELMQDIENPKVFITWGSDARETYETVEEVYRKKQFVSHPHLHLHAFHPAFDLRKKEGAFGEITPDYPRTFLGNSHFSKTNEFLKKFGRKEIKW
jgi:uracil-DNA glycosylase